MFSPGVEYGHDKTGLRPVPVLVLVLQFRSWSWSWSCASGLGLGLNILVLFPIVKMTNKANNQLITVYASFNYLVINTVFLFYFMGMGIDTAACALYLLLGMDAIRV